MLLLTEGRRHAAPPKTNFEALNDLLVKRKGLELDVSSNGALARSLDACVVSVSCGSFRMAMLTKGRTRSGPSSTPWCESWRRGACSRQSTFALAVCPRRPTGITVSQARSTPISP
jgi:hypothetical protein